MNFILRNLELLLTALGVAVAFTVPLLFGTDEITLWKVGAITALSVGILHGVLFWIVRRRQHQVRQKTIRQIQVMMQDIVSNKLQIISMAASQRPAVDESLQKRIEMIDYAVDSIADAVNYLSEESLKAWRYKYESINRGLERRIENQV